MMVGASFAMRKVIRNLNVLKKRDMEEIIGIIEIEEMSEAIEVGGETATIGETQDHHFREAGQDEVDQEATHVPFQDRDIPGLKEP